MIGLKFSRLCFIIFQISLVENVSLDPKMSSIDEWILEITPKQSPEMYFVTRSKRDKKMIRERGRSLLEYQVTRPRSRRSILNNILNSVGLGSSRKSVESETCYDQYDPPDILCDEESRYRRHDGHCNNLAHPSTGAGHTAQPRLVSSQYTDHQEAPRSVSVATGRSLPSARTVSQGIHHDRGQSPEQAGYSLMLMQWGQFLDHDLTLVHSPLPALRCECREYNKTSDPLLSRHCFPIPVSPSDSFYSGSGAPECLQFRRSAGVVSGEGGWEQVNDVTSHIDGSQVYGSSKCESDRLRGHAGQLKTFFAEIGQKSSKNLLPLADDVPDCRGEQCFIAGDVRVNEQPGLTVLHTIIMRLHNIIAQHFTDHRDTLDWSDDDVYEETRRIVISILQHITYTEFLPRVLGPDVMERFGLEVERWGHFTHYSPDCSTAVFNEFSAAAFRFGHSMIQPELVLMSDQEMVSGDHQDYRTVSLRDHFHNPQLIMNNPDAVEEILRGMMMMPIKMVNKQFSEEVTNHLFEEKRRQFSGLDLVALNIQRGRDHGIPGYNEYRELCGQERLSSWSGDSVVEADALEMMSGVYDDPDDVDLFTGLMSELRLPGSLVGPTLACIIGLQFQRLRQCDRHWYETRDPALSFTTAQLTSVRAVTLSHVLCSTGHDLSRVPRSVFDLHHPDTNPMITCSDHDHLPLDLRPWLEASDTRDSCQYQDQTPCSTCQCTPLGDVCRAGCADLINMFGVEVVKHDCKIKCLINEE